MLGKHSTTEQQCELCILVSLSFSYILVSGRQGMCLNYLLLPLLCLTYKRFVVAVSRTDCTARTTLKTVSFSRTSILLTKWKPRFLTEAVFLLHFVYIERRHFRKHQCLMKCCKDRYERKTMAVLNPVLVVSEPCEYFWNAWAASSYSAEKGLKSFSTLISFSAEAALLSM